MITRRNFLKYTGGTALTWYIFNKFGVLKSIAQVPGGTLDPDTIPKFQTPLLIPPVMPKAAKIVQQGGKNVDYYEISIKQFAQQILPAGLPATTVWGYGAVSSKNKRGLLLHHAPSLTIEARSNTPVRATRVMCKAMTRHRPRRFKNTFGATRTTSALSLVAYLPLDRLSYFSRTQSSQVQGGASPTG